MKRTKSIFKCMSVLFVTLSILAVSCEEETPKPVDKPKSVTVTIQPGGTMMRKKGDTVVFTAEVKNVKKGAKNTVTWELNNSPFLQNPTSGGSKLTVSQDGFEATLVIGDNQTTPLTVTAVSDFDEKIYDAVVVNISLIDRIVINGPSTANQGNPSVQFTANVLFAEGATGNLNKDVTWSVARKTGTKASATSINSQGLLSISQSEALGVLAVTATSVYDSSITQEAELTVTDPTGAPVVHNVEVIAYPSIENDTVLRGQTYTFRAQVSYSGSANEDVTWSVTGGSGGTKIDKGNDNIGELTVTSGQTAGAILTITAVSTSDTSKSGSTMVTVAMPRKLDPPSRPTLNEQGVAGWSYPDHPSLTGFSIQLHKNDMTFSAPVRENKDVSSVNLLSAMRSGSWGLYTVTVTAIADGINFFDSDASFESETRTVRQRRQAENLQWDGYTASWTVEDHYELDNFIVNLYKDNDTTAKKRITVDSGLSVNLQNDITENGYFSFTVEAPGDGYLVFDANIPAKAKMEKPVLRSLWIYGQKIAPARQAEPFDGKFTWYLNILDNTAFSFSFNNTSATAPNSTGYWFVPAGSNPSEVTFDDDENSIAEAFGNAGNKLWNITQGGQYIITLCPETMTMRVEEGAEPYPLDAPSQPTFDTNGEVTWSYVEKAVGYILRLYKGSSTDLVRVGDPVQIRKEDDATQYTYNFRSVILENGADVYRVTVAAIGDGKLFGDSEESQASSSRTYTVLGNPPPHDPPQTTRTWGGTDITWSAVTGAVAYEVMITKKNNDLWPPIWETPVRVTGTRFAAAEHLANRDYGGTGTYSFSLRSIGSGLALDSPSFTATPHEKYHLILDVSESGGVFGSSQIYSIAYGGNGLFVAVGNNRKIMRSTDYGVTWTLVADGEDDLPATLRAVTYGNGMFIAVGNRGTIMRSTTGETWTNVPNTFTNYVNPPDLRGVAFSGGSSGRFMAVGTNSRDVEGSNRVNRVIHSTNGTTWNVTANGSTNFDLSSVAYGNGRFVAVGPSGRLTMSGENDAHTTWSRVSNSILNTNNNNDNPDGTPNNGNVPANAVAFGNGRFVIVGDGGNVARGSTTLTTHSGWLRSTLSSEFNVNSTNTTRVGICSIVYAEDADLFFAVMHNGRIGTSPTGEAWTTVPRSGGGAGTTRFGEGEGIYALSYGGGRFVLGGNAYATGTQSKIAYSY